MAEKSFTSHVKMLLQGQQIDVQGFWMSLEGKYQQALAKEYFLNILQAISNPSRRSYISKYEQNLIATLLALFYFKNINTKEVSPTILSALQKYKDRNPYGQWIQQLIKNSQDRQFFAITFMSKLVMAPNNFDWKCNIETKMHIQKKINEEFIQRKYDKFLFENSHLRLKNVSNYEIRNLQINSLSLAYVCFIDYVKSNRNYLSGGEYYHILNLMKAMINFSRSEPQSKNLVCSLLHFVIQIITFQSCPYEQILEELFMMSNHFRNFYGPVGQLADELFRLLEKEIKIPGYAFRKKLRIDYPSIDIKDSSELGGEVFLVTEQKDILTPQEPTPSLSNIRKMIIWQIIKNSGLPKEETSNFLEVLRQLNNAQTYTVYFKCMKICDLCVQMEVFAKIKSTMKISLSLLMKETINRTMSDRKKHTSSEMQELDYLISEANSNPLTIPKYPNYDILHCPLSSFAKEMESGGAISERIRIQQKALVLYRASTPIVFYGKNSEFSIFINVIARFLEQADIEQMRNLKIYYIPKPETQQKQELGSYIASRDLWYRRFVYNPAKQCTIYPFLEPSPSCKNCLPYHILNETLQMYLREAKRMMKFKIGKCHIVCKDSEKDQLVYFTSSVTMGIFTQAQIIKNNKLKTKAEKYKNKDLVEIIKEKIKRTNPWTADIEIEWIEPLTNSIYSQTHKNIKFEDLQILNQPCDYFLGERPDPCQGKGLKFSLLQESKSKLFWKQLLNSSNFKENKKTEQILLAFRDIFTLYTIRRAKLTNMGNENIKILVDGTIYSKVQSFQVETVVTQGGFELAAPISTFLPFK